MPAEILQLIISGNASGAIKASAEAAAAQGELAAETSATNGVLGKFGVSGQTAGLLVKAGIVTAGLAIGKFALDSVSRFADATSSVRQFQRVSLATAEDSSKLVFAANRLGIETDSLSSATGRFLARVGSGKVDLDNYGISLKQNADGSTDVAGTMANVAQRFSELKDPQDRARLGNELFGRSWQTLLPLLSKSKDELKGIYDIADRQKLVFSQADLEKGKEYKLALDDLKTAFQGLQVQVGSAIVPTLTAGAKGITSVVEAADAATAPIGGFGAAIQHANDFFNPFTMGAHAASAASNLLSGDFGGAAEEFGRSLPVVGGVIGLFDSGSDSAGKFADGQKKLADATKTVADLAADGKQHTQEYRDAQRDLRAATDEQTAAQKRATDALTTDNQQMLTSISLRLQAAGGALGLLAAQEQLAKANDDVAQKQAAASFMTAAYGANSLQAIGASQDLAAAQTQGAQAALGLDAAYANQIATMQKNHETKASIIEQLEAEKNKYVTTAPAIAAAIQSQIDKLNGVKFSADQLPGAKSVAIGADTSPFNNALAGVATGLIGVSNSSASPTIGGPGGTGRTLHIGWAEGGPVPGPRGAPLFGTVHGGEYVLSADVVDRIKRGAPSLGASAGIASGGASGGGRGPTVIHQHFDASLATDLVAFGRVAKEAIEAAEVRGG